VSTVVGRAEALLHDHAARFDAVTARAVAKLAALLPWTAPFARQGGRVLLIKGERAEQELAEAARVLTKLHCRHERTVVTSTGRVVVLRVG
jgi:16S rRNA (guanine527-N7)-methyltransferase